MLPEGIGRATCVALARAARVCSPSTSTRRRRSRSRTSCAPTARQALALAADVSDAAAVEGYVAHALATWGRLDALFNNAGIEGAVAPLEQYPLDVYDRVMTVNVRSVFLGLKHALPAMREQRSGSIVNCSSVSGLRGAAGTSAYAASKHAVIGLTRVAAAEAGADGVRVNAVLPGADRDADDDLDRAADDA